MSQHSNAGDANADMDINDDDKTASLEEQPLPASVAHSLLYELPRELRERIYSLVLTIPEDRNIEWPTPVKRRPLHLQPALLRTCKIILSEAAPLLYTMNCFEWSHPSDANVFVRAFASPIYAKIIAHVRLDLKAADMRLWMPYLTSTDEVRSLRADFPNMRALSLRYQSQKWLPHRAPEENLKAWIDDIRLDEIIRSLRTVFPSKATEGLDNHDLGIGDQEFRDYLARNPVNFDDPVETREFRTRLHAAHKIHHAEKVRVAREYAAALKKRYASVPAIRITCACRVPETHFTHLVAAATAPPASAPAIADEESPEEPPIPVVEGEPYRGFTAVDFRNHLLKDVGPEVGTVGVALTPYVERHGVMLALEIDFNRPRVVRIG